MLSSEEKLKSDTLTTYFQDEVVGTRQLFSSYFSFEESQEEIINLIVTNELEESPLSLLEDIRVPCKPYMLIEEPCEDQYY